MKRGQKESVILKFANPFLVFPQQEGFSRYELIRKLAGTLVDKGFVDHAYIENAMIRERMSATTIGAGIAIPHGHPDLIHQSAIAIATLREPIEWGEEKVSLVSSSQSKAPTRPNPASSSRNLAPHREPGTDRATSLRP